MGVFLKATTIVSISLFFSVVWLGYVFFMLWGWFVVDTFAVAPLTIPQAIGISILMSIFAQGGQVIKTMDDLYSQIIASFFTPLFFLLIGYIVALFI